MVLWRQQVSDGQFRHDQSRKTFARCDNNFCSAVRVPSARRSCHKKKTAVYQDDRHDGRSDGPHALVSRIGNMGLFIRLTG